jgi:hypothetical protein
MNLTVLMKKLVEMNHYFATTGSFLPLLVFVIALNFSSNSIAQSTKADPVAKATENFKNLPRVKVPSGLSFI